MEQVIFHNSANYTAENNEYIKFFGKTTSYNLTYSLSEGKSTQLKAIEVLKKNYTSLGGSFMIKNNSVDKVVSHAFVNEEEGIIISITDYTSNKNIITSITCKCTTDNIAPVNRLLSLLPCSKVRKNKNQKINLLTYKNDSFKLTETQLGRVGKNPLLRYPEEFGKFHTNIVKKLKEKSSGILLLHGEPGTGKTSYIKYLTSVVDRKFVIVPNYMVKELSSPTFIPFLVENPDLILILEDAEDQVASRDTTRNSGVAEILNLSDGLIGSAFNCSLICTFNTELRNIDSALMRKGRLIGEHKFDKLSRYEANKLLVSLGKPPIATGYMSLAEVYNADEELFKEKKERNTVGFVINGG